MNNQSRDSLDTKMDAYIKVNCGCHNGVTGRLFLGRPVIIKKIALVTDETDSEYPDLKYVVKVITNLFH